MKVTTREDLVEHLRQLGLGRGDRVMVHSGLMAFGIIDGGPQTVFEAFREVLGDEGTLVVPTYRDLAPPDEIYDPATSPSVKVGVLPEIVRQQPDAVRSRCPMHNHAGVGPHAQVLLEPDGHVSLGPGSDFDILHQHDFKNLYLGVGRAFTEAATFLIHLQAMFGQVPYREWLDLTRKVRREDGTVEGFVVHYYGRRDLTAREDLTPAVQLLEERGWIQFAKCSYGISSCTTFAAMHDAVMPALRKNPTLFLAGDLL